MSTRVAGRPPARAPLVTAIGRVSSAWLSWFTELYRMVDDNATPKAKIYRSSNQTGIVTATPTKLSFNAVDFDNNSIADVITNNRFTIDRVGTYQITAQAEWVTPAAACTLTIMVYKNGLEVSRMSSNGTFTGGAFTSQISDVLELTIADYIEIWVLHDSGANRTITGAISKTFAVLQRI